MRSAGYHEKMNGRTYFGGDQVTQLNLVLYNTINWPYQRKHSPSLILPDDSWVVEGDDNIRLVLWQSEQAHVDIHIILGRLVELGYSLRACQQGGPVASLDRINKLDQ